jgi:hypothetical protein
MKRIQDARYKMQGRMQGLLAPACILDPASMELV